MECTKLSHIHYCVKGNANGLISKVIAKFSAHTVVYNSLMHIDQRRALQNESFKKWSVILQLRTVHFAIKALVHITG